MMLDNLDLLSIITFLPLVCCLFFTFAEKNPEAANRQARHIALAVTTINFVLSLGLFWQFDPTRADFQLVREYHWFGDGISFKVGIDGHLDPLIWLTTALLPLCILASWTSVETRVREYMIAFLVLESLMIGVFTSLNLIAFYLFFEAGLIPMFLIIGIWGGKRRVYASFKFFLYTLLGSLLMLVAIVAMWVTSGTTDIEKLLAYHFPPAMQTWLWLAFLASFAVKMPMWPVHTWLPDAHVEAPTAGSVILAAILLKMGGYGFLRFSLPMFPIASHELAPLIFALSVIAIIYTSACGAGAGGHEKLIAYSSVAHMGFVTMGIFAVTVQGIEGGIFQMFSHGIVSAALFLCVGVIYDRMHTREISAYGGLVHRMPIYAFCLMLFTLANVGLPGTSGFVGEFLSVIGVFQVNNDGRALCRSGVILSAMYALYLYRRVIFGPLLRVELKNILDMNLREIAIMAPLVVGAIVFGVWPTPVLKITEASVQNLIKSYTQAVADASTHQPCGSLTPWNPQAWISASTSRSAHPKS